MKCKYCGEEVSPRDRYCPNCGHINESYLTNDYNNDVDETNDDPFENVYKKRANDNQFVYTPPTEEELSNIKPAYVSPVFGILSLIFGILGSLAPALVLGIIGLKKYPKDNPDCAKYRNMCIAGIVIGIIMFILSLIIYIWIFKAYLSDYSSVWEDSFY